jgi:hypothetical protein
MKFYNIGPGFEKKIAETSEEGIGEISERKRFVRFSSHKRRETQQITFLSFLSFFSSGLASSGNGIYYASGFVLLLFFLV